VTIGLNGFGQLIESWLHLQECEVQIIADGQESIGVAREEILGEVFSIGSEDGKVKDLGLYAFLHHLCARIDILVLVLIILWEFLKLFVLACGLVLQDVEILELVGDSLHLLGNALALGIGHEIFHWQIAIGIERKETHAKERQ